MVLKLPDVVTDVYQVLDWASTVPKLIRTDSHRRYQFRQFYFFHQYGSDNRIKAGILIVSGGNSDKLTRHSFLLRRQYKLSSVDYEKNQEAYFKYLSEVAEKGFENVTALKSSYLTDPMTFSSYLRGRPLLMINAMWDEMIPKESTLDLWESCGRPPIKWYPATHASIWAWYPVIGQRISEFLISVYNQK